jgi:hypothetical protein
MFSTSAEAHLETKGYVDWFYDSLELFRNGTSQLQLPPAIFDDIKTKFSKIDEDATRWRLPELKEVWAQKQYLPWKKMADIWLTSIMPHAKHVWDERFANQTHYQTSLPIADQTYRCAERGITNSDGSCTIVALFQIMRKTALYPFINENLKRIIDGAIVNGTYNFDNDTCPLLPLEIRDAYKTICGFPLELTNIRFHKVFQAVILTSPKLDGRVTLNRFHSELDPSTKVRGTQGYLHRESFPSVWDNQTEFNNAITTVSGKCRLRDFMFGGVFSDIRDRASDDEWTQQPMANGCEQISMLMTYLGTFDYIGITAGVVTITWPGETDQKHILKHAVTFVKCDGDVHFFNWGKRKTGTEIKKMDNANMSEYFTDRIGPFKCDFVVFLWDLNFCPEYQTWSVAALLSDMDILVLGSLVKVLYNSPNSQSMLNKLDANETKLLQQYTAFLPGGAAMRRPYPASLWRPFNKHWKLPLGFKPSREQETQALTIHNHATGYRRLPTFEDAALKHGYFLQQHNEMERRKDTGD